jgi:2'-5' RNA ligase
LSDLIRSFIAVEVPPAAAEAIRSAQRRLQRADGSWKWVSPESYHVTLKFLGAVASERLRALWQTVSETLSGTAAFGVTFRGIGAFPNRSRARVVWAGIAEGAAQLTDLASRVENACATYGFEREKRAFHAHLTLGRARRPGAGPDLADAMGELETADLGEAQMDRVMLMKSELTRSGAIYTVIDEVTLTGGSTA